MTVSGLFEHSPRPIGFGGSDSAHDQVVMSIPDIAYRHTGDFSFYTPYLR